MNKIKYVFFVVFITIGLFSCQKADDNGDLGGFWKLMSIQYLSNDSVENLKKENRFMAIQLDLLALRNGASNRYARFNYNGDSLFIKMIDENVSKDFLNAFGMNGYEQSFLVEQLNNKKLVISSLFAKLTFKKF